MEEVYEENSGIEFALFLGDMVENPADNKDWEEFFDNKQRAFGDLEVYTTPGNHETSVTPSTYLKKFELPGEWAGNLRLWRQHSDRGILFF